MRNKAFPRRALCALLALCAMLTLALPAFAAAKTTLKEGKDYQWVDTQYKDEQLNTDPLISMKTEHASYAPGTEEVYVEITNKGKISATYGVAFVLERKGSADWQAVEQIEGKDTPIISFIAIGYTLPKGSTRGIAVNTGIYTGPLPAGEYRIIKDVIWDTEGVLEDKLHHLSAEFTIAKGGKDTAAATQKPLSELSAGYTAAQAEADGVYMISSKGKPVNGEKLLVFMETVEKEMPASLRYYSDGVVMDITHNERQKNFKVEARSKSGALSTEYYTYLTVRKTSKKTAVLLCNSLGKQYKTGRELIILKDIKKAASADRKKIEKLGKTMFRGDEDFRVYGPDGVSHVVYRKDTGSDEYVYWNLPEGKNGELEKEHFPGKEVVDIRWINGATVEIDFTSAKKNEYNTLTLDVEKGEINQLVVVDAIPTDYTDPK